MCKHQQDRNTCSRCGTFQFTSDEADAFCDLWSFRCNVATPTVVAGTDPVPVEQEAVEEPIAVVVEGLTVPWLENNEPEPQVLITQVVMYEGDFARTVMGGPDQYLITADGEIQVVADEEPQEGEASLGEHLSDALTTVVDALTFRSSEMMECGCENRSMPKRIFGGMYEAIKMRGAFGFAIAKTKECPKCQIKRIATEKKLDEEILAAMAWSTLAVPHSMDNIRNQKHLLRNRLRDKHPAGDNDLLLLDYFVRCAEALTEAGVTYEKRLWLTLDDNIYNVQQKNNATALNLMPGGSSIKAY